MPTILVVDDEPALRLLYRGFLLRNGYTVLEARDGVEALEILEKQDVAAVVSDVVMPRMGGRELLWRVQALRPSVPVILTSGVLPASHLDLKGEAPPACYLAKPLDPTDLVRAVAEALA